MDDKEKKRKEEMHQEPVELTPAEKKELETLPRDLMPGFTLEDRIVDALYDRGILFTQHRRVIELTKRRIATVVAACIVLLATGFALGQWTGARQITGYDIITPEISDISVAATLQRAGSEYVLALQHFTGLPDSVNGDQAVQGREVALTTLYTAANQLTRLVPKDDLARQLLLAIDAGPRSKIDRTGPVTIGTRVMEF